MIKQKQIRNFRVIWFSTDLVLWPKHEIESFNRKTRKTLFGHGVLTEIVLTKHITLGEISVLAKM